MIFFPIILKMVRSSERAVYIYFYIFIHTGVEPVALTRGTSRGTNIYLGAGSGMT